MEVPFSPFIIFLSLSDHPDIESSLHSIDPALFEAHAVAVIEPRISSNLSRQHFEIEWIRFLAQAARSLVQNHVFSLFLSYVVPVVTLVFCSVRSAVAH
ncbi:hypothetical protein D3C73_1255100 [compost metagenome]